MENIIKQIREIESDLHTVINRAEGYRNDVERGINVNHTCDMSWTKQDKINSLFEYLEDAKNDIDRLKDDIKEAKNHLTNLLDDVEYESVRQKAVGES
jgi:regulator of replication initiation timing